MCPRTVEVARSAVTGRFVSKQDALEHRETTIVETYEMTSSRRRIDVDTRRRRTDRPE